MNRAIELLAPGGDVDAIKAAIIAGADAVYCGLDKFNARNRAANISFESLQGLLGLAHSNNCQIFITLNILITDNELKNLFELLNKLVNTKIDGVIIQDIGLFYLLNKYFPSLKTHASTQLTTHNTGQLRFLKRLSATRVNLSRELNIDEIEELSKLSHELNLLTEVFVHGSNCISFSGQCYMSSVHSGNSGNRGRCSQPCRDAYTSSNNNITYPLNIKDNSAFLNLTELIQAGVDSLKIEGRIKKYDYVYSVVKTWSDQLKRYRKNKTLSTDDSSLFKVFNRDYSNGFLKNDISRKLFIDSPRDYSLKRLALFHKSKDRSVIQQHEALLLDEKELKAHHIKQQIDAINIDILPIRLKLNGSSGSKLSIDVHTPNHDFVIHSTSTLSTHGKEAISSTLLKDKFQSITETGYNIKGIDLNDLPEQLYLPFKDLNQIKKEIVYVLNGAKPFMEPVNLPKLNQGTPVSSEPQLSVLISSPDDIALCTNNEQLFFQLPNDIASNSKALSKLLTDNPQLTPLFPAILIGENYNAALDLLDTIQARIIVSNNTGIGYEAHKRNINWIAGPQMNLTNSYSLMCLKEQFNCSGAFISNELSQMQIRSIKKPDDFDLYFSIYHPNLLMTSRLCLNHQINNCSKEKMDKQCLSNCETSSEIVNSKGQCSVIHKSKGQYHHMYDEKDYLNLEVCYDLSKVFTGYMVDLRRMKYKTKRKQKQVIKLFHEHLKGSPISKIKLMEELGDTSCQQYKKGI